MAALAALAALAGCAHTSRATTAASSTSPRATTSTGPPTTARRATTTTRRPTTTTSAAPAPTGAPVPATTAAPVVSAPAPPPPPTLPPLVPGSVASLTFTNGGRTLPTALYVPAGPRPWPTVVFAAGFDIEPGAYDVLLRQWAGAGFLVAAPASPGMAPSLGPVTEAQLPNVPGDLSAVTSNLVALGLADRSHLAAVGHSDGASAVGALALTADHADGRFRAYVVLAGDITTLPDSYGPRNGAPLFAATGDHDEFDNIVLTPQLYATAAAPKALVVAHGGDHLGLFVGTGTQQTTMRAAILGFLRASVRGGPWSALRSLDGAAGLDVATAGI